MQRRQFIAGLGSAAAWPLQAGAQQDARVRRIGLLTSAAEGDPILKANLAALWEGLAKLGWTEGRNLRIELRFTAGDVGRLRAAAAELARLALDAIVLGGANLTAINVIQQENVAVPIIFAEGPDPVAYGVVQNLARPEGNATGFANFEPSIGGKWLELLKEAVPRLARVASLFNPELALAPWMSRYISQIETVARPFPIYTTVLRARDPIEIVRALDEFAKEPNGGLIVLPPPSVGAYRDAIIRLAEQNRLPAIHVDRQLAAAGGLLSYGSNIADQYRRTATYVDRLLHGAKVADLPVQFPTKYELVVNLRTARAIGLTIPESLLLRADEVIE
jgi:ABC-type uncharacterized transport system substrate-binding protein